MKNNEIIKKIGSANVTFSRYCISGYLGDKCHCNRCRVKRGLQVTEESEELSKYQSLLYRDIGGIKDAIWSGLYPELEKGVAKSIDLANAAYKRVKNLLETGNFNNEENM